ncbi:MAG TPA: YeeE/YedE thiosulfate transporter family protein [Bacteroidota bacterium]|nr:YeeE/YedE thiosulfate transporter family protein [Bacteroidota bacterium]
MKTNYMNPYLAGFLLGLVLLATIFITGRGLGASGAIKDLVVTTVDGIAPRHAEQSSFFGTYVGPGKEHPLKQWLVFEVVGVLIGGFLSGLVSDRLKVVTEAGPKVSPHRRWLFAALGGALFAAGAQFARGCTSGAALSGMAVLSTAGFVAMLAIFGSGYAFAYVARKLWL